MTPAHSAPPIAVDLRAAVRCLEAGAAVLDTRGESDFEAGHLVGAGRIGRHEFVPRRAELPARDSQVIVVHDDPSEASAAAHELHALGYQHVHWLDAPLGTIPGGHEARSHAARLWRPSPFLERIAPMLTPKGSVLDLAAGSGRESVWMASCGYEVHAWDRAAEALERAEALARREQVQLHTRIVDLERRTLPSPGKHDVVMVFRFLHRLILPWIADAVAPGGMLVYETYAKGQERFGRPKHPRFLFQSGEIARSFPDLRVLVHEEPSPDEGPILARVVAVRDP